MKNEREELENKERVEGEMCFKTDGVR